MSNMKYLLLVIILCTSSALQASESSDEKSLEQQLAALKLEKAQAEVMIKTMVKSGRMDDEEAKVAARAIASVQEEDADNIRNAALERIKSSKSFATK